MLAQGRQVWYQKETRSHLLRTGKPQRFAGKQAELAVRTTGKETGLEKKPGQGAVVELKNGTSVQGKASGEAERQKRLCGPGG